MTTYIYTLSDPRTGQIRYVGKTIQPEIRARQHYQRYLEHSHKARWIKGLIDEGLEPTFELLDECSDEDWAETEQYWIQFLSGWGFRLCNGDNGGLGRGRLTKEIKEKISNTLKGRVNKSVIVPIYGYDKNGDLKFSFDSIADAAEFFSGKRCCANICRSAKENNFVSAYGYRWRYEKYDKIEMFSRPPRIVNAVTRMKLSIAQIGKKLSAETREKQRIAALNRKKRT